MGVRMEELGAYLSPYNPIFYGSLSSASGYIALGAAPPATGAIRVDESSFGSGAGLSIGHTTAIASIGAQPGYVYIGGNKQLYINCSSRLSFVLSSPAAGTAELAFNQATSRIIGGSTNGLAIRNSANTRDNFRLYDSGSQVDFWSATYGLTFSTSGGTGEVSAGWLMQSVSASAGLWLVTQGTTGSKLGLSYYNQTQRYSALEVADVASGYGTLALMKSGGGVAIGTDPGGSYLLRVGGDYYSIGFIKSAGPTSGIGYTTGAGGAVTQLTSRTTGVTLNKVCGAITLFTAAGSATPTTFTVTNSTVAATDTIRVVQKSGADQYVILVTAVAAGSFNITFYTTGGTTNEAPVFNFAVIKGVVA